MRSWLISNTFYGTWLPGDPRGSITNVRDRRPDDPADEHRIIHNIPGTAWENALSGLHRAATAALKCPPIHIDATRAEALLSQFLETAQHREWLLRAVAIMFNHVHLVVQVHDDPEPRKFLADFKAYGSRTLNQRFGKPGSGTWWTTNGSKRKLPDEAAVAAAIKYVLYKQPRPLVVWSDRLGRIV